MWKIKVLYLPCRVVARINYDVVGKGTGHHAKFGKNFSEMLGT